MIVVERVERVTPEVVEALARLVPQLSPGHAAPTAGELEEIVGARRAALFVARGRGGAIAGTATLTVFRIPTGLRAWIDDVVVDDAARGQGLGEALVRAALDHAAALGAASVQLTSRPSREAANRLYVRMGFERRETNAYQYTFEGEGR